MGAPSRRTAPSGTRAATSPWIAHAVDCAFELPPRCCGRPPSAFCSPRMYATAASQRRTRARRAPRAPASAAAVSSTSLASPFERKLKPPSSFCWSREPAAGATQHGRVGGHSRPRAARGSANAVRLTCPSTEPFAPTRLASAATRSCPANARGDLPAAASTRIVRSRSPVPVAPLLRERPAACARRPGERPSRRRRRRCAGSTSASAAQPV